MADPNLSKRRPHDEAEELLPWYATGRLDDADRSRVEKHLSSCAFCRQQLALERRLIDEFQALTPEVESGWARLRSRVQSPIPLRQRRPNPLAEVWGFVTRPAIAGLAAAQMAFVIVSGVVLLSLSKPVYHTLGSAPVPVSANIIVMFRAQATIDDVRGTLSSAGASIVDGPTTADAYLLHVAPQQRQRALARLQSDDNVQMAQPIDGAGL